MRSIAVIVALAGVTACAGPSSTGINSQQLPGQEVLVAVGDTVSLGETGLRVGFHSVKNDSRCPIDVVCITAGFAEIQLDLKRPGGADEVGLLAVGHSGTTPRSLVFNGYLIELVALDPEPVSSQQNPAYQARLRYRFLPD
jgi:hypothetical protein